MSAQRDSDRESLWQMASRWAALERNVRPTLCDACHSWPAQRRVVVNGAVRYACERCIV